MSNQYRLNVSRFGTHNIIAKVIGDRNSLVLDVGCNKGYLKRLVPNNVFYGIDSCQGDLEVAAKEYAQTCCLNLNNPVDKIFNDIKFDFMVFGDVLEHLLKPEDVLNRFVNYSLKEDGVVIVSLPNVANFMIRIRLLFGNFDYADDGILDKTHLHFYTVNTGLSLVKSSGLKVVEIKASSNYFGFLIKHFPFLASMLGHSLIFVCKKC